MARTTAPCYVYCLLDPRKPGPFKYGKWTFSHEPFYVGKGSGNRMYDHLRPEGWAYNPFKGRIIQKIQSLGLDTLIVVKKWDLVEAAAMDYERSLIKLIGRRNLKLGPLTNLTDGGDGVLGKVWSDQEKAVASKRNLQRWADMGDVQRQAISNKLRASYTKPTAHEDFVAKVALMNPSLVVTGTFSSYSSTRDVNVLHPCGCEETFKSRSLVVSRIRPCFQCKFKEMANKAGLSFLTLPSKTRDRVTFTCKSNHTFSADARVVYYGVKTKCPHC